MNMNYHNLIKEHLPLINSTPKLQSILYDYNLMPEQIETYKDAYALVAVCVAYSVIPKAVNK